MKERFTIQASSLSSYLGVGYNSISDQFLIDLGEKEVDFTEEQKARMTLGKSLENGVLDYFETVIGTKIINRNSGKFTAFNGKVVCMTDGECIYNGLPTIVECKVSLSDMPITSNKGYYTQTQCYMEGKGYDQALLIGLQNGIPVANLIKKDNDYIKVLSECVDKVIDVLYGVSTVDEYKDWFKSKAPEEEQPKETIDGSYAETLRTIAELKAKESECKKQRDALEKTIKENYKNAKFSNDFVSATVSTSTRSGGYNMDLIILENPSIDFEKYKKPNTTVTVLRCKLK